MFDRILVAVDGSKAATCAVETAGRLAHALGSRVAVVHVIDTAKGFTPKFNFASREPDPEERRRAERLLIEAQHRLPDGVACDEFLRSGDPVAEILDVASRWHAELIVAGAHARDTLTRVLLGSIAKTLIRNATCPVMTVANTPFPSEKVVVAEETCQPRAVQT